MMRVIPADDEGNPQLITIGGIEAECSRFVYSSERRVQVVGEYGDRAFPVRVIVADFGGIDLKAQDFATFNGTEYQIVARDYDVMENSVVLMLGDQYA